MLNLSCGDDHLGSPLVFPHCFSFLCCIVFCFVCLCPASCVPNIASVSGLSILYFASNVYFQSTQIETIFCKDYLMINHVQFGCNQISSF
jgi:hypothetical protein